MGTTTKWGRAKLNSSTIEHDAAAAGAQNVPRIPFANLTSQPPIPFQNRSRRRSTTLDFEWTQTTLRKTREEAARGRRKRRGSSRPAKENGGAVHGRRKERKRGSSQPEKEKGNRRRNAQQVGGRMFAMGSTPATDWRRVLALGRN
ncbi:hypothetical protein Adt_12815 [Abeliophyllum distichum]|uniref:Uncharacterized protein n=1 Tax=Abeliophyllum distichum TaxID=126358 RepID=A0ABD1S219_9LAMI